MIIDAHVHLFPNEGVARDVQETFRSRYQVGYYTLGTIKNHHAEMERCEMDYAVALSFAPDNQLKNNNFWTVAVTRPAKRRAALYPRIIPYISVSPTQKGRTPLQELEHKYKWGMKGLKLHPIAQHFAPDDARMWPVYQWLVQHDLPLTAHCGINVRPDEDTYLAHPNRWLDVLKRFPGLRLTLAHMGGGFWEDTLRICRLYPQVMLDTAIAICGVHHASIKENWLSDNEALEMIRTVGAGRVMFGSDYPWIDPFRDIQRIRSLSLSEPEKRMILGENAARLHQII
ncbi:MAG: amidohydrolase family protein [Anaerolineae bacterium]|nr:amidohydrolase family protein [Anaerolineae bacterium]